MRRRAATFAIADVDHAGSMAGAPTIEVPVGLNNSGNESAPPDSENETTPPESTEYDDNETGRRWHANPVVRLFCLSERCSGRRLNIDPEHMLEKDLTEQKLE
eukprot:scaffold90574_cov28-Attheya_sp.AAC.2